MKDSLPRGNSYITAALKYLGVKKVQKKSFYKFNNKLNKGYKASEEEFPQEFIDQKISSMPEVASLAAKEQKLYYDLLTKNSRRQFFMKLIKFLSLCLTISLISAMIAFSATSVSLITSISSRSYFLIIASLGLSILLLCFCLLKTFSSER
jgi:hypothetical protein